MQIIPSRQAEYSAIVKNLREKEGSFTSKRIQLDSGVKHVTSRTVRNHLNQEGYWYLQSRKKGLLHTKNLRSVLGFVGR